MNPVAQFNAQEDEYLGFGMYYSPGPWDESYHWRGPDWSDSFVEALSRVCAGSILILGGVLIAQAIAHKRMSDWMALAFFACAYAQGLLFAMLEQGIEWVELARFTRILPAFTVLACVAALRQRPSWWAWVPIDLGILVLLALSFFAHPNAEDLSGPLYSIPWLLLWAVVRLRTRGGRTVEGLQADAWRLLAVAHLLAMALQSLLSLTLGLKMAGFLDFILGGLLMCMSMAAFTLGLFQLAIQPRASVHA
jgi:hypothetical protein